MSERPARIMDHAVMRHRVRLLTAGVAACAGLASVAATIALAAPTHAAAPRPAHAGSKHPWVVDTRPARPTLISSAASTRPTHRSAAVTHTATPTRPKRTTSPHPVARRAAPPSRRQRHNRR